MTNSRTTLPDLVPATVAALVGFLVFTVTLAGGFAYDFNYMVADDHRLRDPHQWGYYWAHGYGPGVDNLYRPLTSMLLAVQSYLHGFDPAHNWRFHLLSIVMHAGVCALVAELARRLVNGRVALIAGLLYAVHPIHVEVLGDIVGQAELLCALGSAGALVLFLSPRMTQARAIAIFACFIVALLSKEQGMLLPLLILVLALCKRLTPDRVSGVGYRGSGENKRRSENSLNPKPETRNPKPDAAATQLLAILLCFSLAAYVFVRENILKLHFYWDRNFLDPAQNPLVLSHGLDRALMPLVLLGHYTQLLFFPLHLFPDYSGDAIGHIAHLNDPYLWLGGGTMLVWFALAIAALRRRAGAMLFCLLALAITYGLVSNTIALIGTNFAERLMYLPSIFFVILIAMALAKLQTPPLRYSEEADRRGKESGSSEYLRPGVTSGRILSTPGTIVLVVLLLAGAFRTISYARLWNDRLALYQYATRRQPRAVRMYLWLASEYYSRGQGEQAMDAMQQAIDQMPGDPEMWFTRAAIAMRLGKFDIAEEDLRQADAIQPSMRTIQLWQDLSDRRAATQPAK